MRAWLRGPAAPGVLLFAGIGLGGFVAIAIGWRVAARTLAVPLQVPALVSGGMGGLALVLLGAGLLNVHLGRRAAAVERTVFDELLDEAAGLVDAVSARRS